MVKNEQPALGELYLVSQRFHQMDVKTKRRTTIERARATRAAIKKDPIRSSRAMTKSRSWRWLESAAQQSYPLELNLH